MLPFLAMNGHEAFAVGVPVNFEKLKLIECSRCLALFNGADMTLRRVQSPNQMQARPGEGTSVNICRSQHILDAPSYEPHLRRATLNISTHCNLKCRYCYANGGRYYTAGSLMTPEIALAAVNWLSRTFPAVEHVHFFGGEPTLNLPVLRTTTSYFRYLAFHGRIAAVPSFGLTTNGYSLTRDQISLLRNHVASVTISLDGPQEIHDALRPNCSGGPTYSKVVDNVKRLQDQGFNPEIECTFTREHLRRGLDITSLMDFFYDELQISILHCPTVIATPESLLWIPLEVAELHYKRAIRYSLENLSGGISKTISIVVRLLKALRSRRAIPSFCPAGREALTINVDGNVYACFMLMDNADLCFGNVFDKAPVLMPEALATSLRNAGKSQPQCEHCWAQSLCFGCVGESRNRDRDELCNYTRSIIECFLQSLVEVNGSSSVNSDVAIPR